MPATAKKKSKALLIGNRVRNDDLKAILSGYGYTVENCLTRRDGVRSFRRNRQPLVIVDIDVVNGFPARFFRFFQMVQEQAIVLIAADFAQESQAARYRLWGAHDVLQLPLRQDELNFTLSRTSVYHRKLVRSSFLKNLFFFSVTMLPLWALLVYLMLR
jgi:DNA-binding NtrC family response regulator